MTECSCKLCPSPPTRYLKTISQSNTGNLSQCRVRLLWRGRINTSANSTLLRTAVQRRNIALGRLRLTSLSDELITSGHISKILWSDFSLCKYTAARMRHHLGRSNIRASRDRPGIPSPAYFVLAAPTVDAHRTANCRGAPGPASS